MDSASSEISRVIAEAYISGIFIARYATYVVRVLRAVKQPNARHLYDLVVIRLRCHRALDVTLSALI